MTKQFWIILGVIVAVMVGVVFLTGDKAKDNGSSSVKGQPSSHIEGEGSKGVLLVEYGDYQCPACGSFYPAIKQTVEKYSKEIKFQFVNFPLQSIHQNAFAAARAAEAAGMQDKFWEMHDILYQQNLTFYANNAQGASWVNSTDPLSYFTQYAQQLGLNVDKFKTDYASSKVNGTINADMSAGNKLKVDSTPTFFLDGKKMANSDFTGPNNQPSAEKFSQVIDAAIKAKENK